MRNGEWLLKSEEMDNDELTTIIFFLLFAGLGLTAWHIYTKKKISESPKIVKPNTNPPPQISETQIKLQNCREELNTEFELWKENIRDEICKYESIFDLLRKRGIGTINYSNLLNWG